MDNHDHHDHMIETGNMFFALVGAVGVAIAAAILGCFIVWRRMAYFGDSMAHSSLLGTALGMAIGLSKDIGVIIVCALFASLLFWLQRQRILTIDSLLGIMAHAALGLGIMLITVLGITDFDMHGHLFGDVMSVTIEHVASIYIVGAIVIIAMLKYWEPMVLMTIHEDLAQAEGVNHDRLHMLLLALVTLVVSVAMHIVGVLLITSMLIIPAASARQITKSPEGMALGAIIISIVAVLFAIPLANYYDMPAGATIVVANTVLFIITIPIALMRK